MVAADVTEPVTLDEVKAWLTVTYSDDDTLLTGLISQCRDGLEKFCTISMVEQEWTLDADLYEDQELPYGPVTGTPTVTWRNGTVYEAYTDFTFDVEAGVIYGGVSGRFKIVYTAGPIDMVSNASLKLDLLRIIGYCYEHRGDEPLTTLTSGMGRPVSLDTALELFAGKSKSMAWL